MEIVHTPVLLDEALDLLKPPRPDALMVDATLGEGGHAWAFLERYPLLRYLGVDADAEIQAKARDRLAPYGDRIRFELGYFDDFFREFGKEAEGGNKERPGVILFDLGVSMFHFKESGRGFSLQGDEPLDMRLSRETGRTASDIVNETDERTLERIFRDFGEEPFSGRIARVIVEERGKSPFTTAGRLAETIRRAVPQKFRYGRIHPATRCFQALRIAVNDELGRAERALRVAAEILAVGGVIGVITFHSLEDRLVKTVFRELSRARPVEEGFKPDRVQPIPKMRGALLELLTKKPIAPGAEEVGRNPASRSAKLRAARRVDETEPGRSGYPRGRREEEW